MCVERVGAVVLHIVLGERQFIERIQPERDQDPLYLVDSTNRTEDISFCESWYVVWARVKRGLIRHVAVPTTPVHSSSLEMSSRTA